MFNSLMIQSIAMEMLPPRKVLHSIAGHDGAQLFGSPGDSGMGHFEPFGLHRLSEWWSHHECDSLVVIRWRHLVGVSMTLSSPGGTYNAKFNGLGNQQAHFHM